MLSGVLKGVVVSVVQSYGFIKDDEGVSYYFNPRKMAAGHDYGKLKVQTPVEFTPAAGPRGMLASNVMIPTFYEGVEQPKQFIALREGAALKDGCTVDEDNLVMIHSVWHESPEAARNELLQSAELAGATCVLDLSYHKRKFSSGNYIYTMHSFSGEAGIYTRSAFFAEEAAALKSKVRYQRDLDDTHELLAQVAVRLNQKRYKQENGWKATLAIVGGVVFMGGVLLMLGSLLL